MIEKIAALGFGLVLLAACAAPPSSQAPNPPPAQPEPAAAPAPELAEPPPLPPVDIRKMTCATLTSASDDDKAYATSFLLGYRSALIHSHMIDTKQMEAAEIAGLADCVGKPDARATKVFGAALARIEGRAEGHPAARAHRRGRPSQAAPGEAPETPSQTVARPEPADAVRPGSPAAA